MSFAFNGTHWSYLSAVLPAVLLTWLSASQTDTETDTVLTILRSPIKGYLSIVLLATLLTWLSASQLTDRHGAHNTPLTYQALP